MTDDCLDDEAVVALAEGALDGDVRAAALLHLESCATCSALVGQAARLGSSDRPSLGRYRMIEEIGAGGMGRVYLAYDPALDREVALKLVDVEALDPGVGAARLVKEAQTLAALDHPAICRVFDIQQHDGTVFIAMELVRGSTFATWLAARPEATAIVSAFVRAGEGLAAAHEAGIVHRDFKPSNVMIDDDPRGGRVAVLDFGLARRERVTESWDEGRSEVTTHDVGRRTGSAFAGTPVYMAPEQYDGIATAASDQYAFCLVLLEALAGRFPFADRGVALLRRAKRERALVDGIVASIPASLRAAVLRGLEPDARSRWPSMRALLDALRGAPRKRWPIVAAGVVTVGLGATAAWVVTRAPGVQCDRAGDGVQQVWNDARRVGVREAFAAAGAEDLAARVEADLGAHADGIAAAYREACLGAHDESDALFDARARCLDRRLRELDAAVGALRELDEAAAASAVSAIDELTGVDRCADEAFLLAMAPVPDDPRIAARALALEAELDRADGELGVGRYREALAMFERAAEDARALEHDPLIAHALAGLAVSLRKLDDPRAAEVAEEAHVFARLVDDPATAAKAATELAHITRRRGRLTEAAQWVAEAELDAARANRPSTRAHVIEAKAAIAYAGNDIEQALALHREAAAIHASIDPKGRQFAVVLTEVATDLRRLERFDEAVATLGEARSVLVSVYGEDSPRLASVESELGTVHLVKGDVAAAIPHLERGLAMQLRKTGEHSRGVVSDRTALGAAYRDAGRLPEAAEQLRLALAVLEQVEHGPREAAITWVHYAKTLTLQGELVAANEAWEKSLGLLGAMEENAAQRDLLGMTLEANAEVLEQLGRGEEAVRMRERARSLAPPK